MGIKDDFILKEIEYLHTHMEGVVKELRVIERYSITATALFWAWIAAKPDVIQIKWFSFLSMIFVFFMFLKSIALKTRYRSMASYIKQEENDVFGVESLYGWQRSRHRDGAKLPLWSDIYYIALLTINLALALWFCFK